MGIRMRFLVGIFIYIAAQSYLLAGGSALSFEPIPYQFIFTKEQQADFIEKHLITDETVSKKLDALYLYLHSSKPEDIIKSPLFHLHKTRPYHVIGNLSVLPDYFIKIIRRSVGLQYFFINKDDIDTNIYRIVEAQRLKDCITKYHLNLLHIPEKKLYHVPGAAWDLNDDNYLVLSKKVPILPTKQNIKLFKRLSMVHKELIDQLFTLIVLTGFDDPHRGNICFLIDSHHKQLHAAIIDTGPIELACKKRDFINGKGNEVYKKAVCRGLGMFKDCLKGEIKEYWEDKMDVVIKRYFK